MTSTRSRLHVGSLIWGLIFLMIAGLGLWVSNGGPLNWKALSIATPMVVIALAGLSLALSRQRS